MSNFAKNIARNCAEKKNIHFSSVIYILLYILLGIAADVCTGFQQTHNDFWDLFYGSQHLFFENKYSLYNMHYPIGYYVFLKIIGIKGVPPEIPGILGNIFFGAIILFTSIILYRKLLSQKISLLLVMVLSFFPSLFLYITNAGPDPASIAFFEIGAIIIFLQILNNGCESKGKFFIGGLILGCGAIFRYHVFVGSSLFLLCLFLVYRNKWRLVLISFAGLVIVNAPQLILYCITGPHHIPFAVINIYNLMYHIDWYRTSSFQFPPSFFWIINQDPPLFLRRYFVSLLRHAPDYVPPLVAYFAIKEPIKKNLCLAILMWSISYCLFFAAMESGRSQLLPLPLSFLCLGLFLEEISVYFQKITRLFKLINVLVPGSLLILLSFCLYKDTRLIMHRTLENKENLRIEVFLRKCGCTNVKEIFTDDFCIYFRTMPPYRPYCNGGATRWETYLYNEQYPEFPIASLEEFSAACRKNRVRFVLLSDQCERLSSSLGRLYNGSSFDGIIFKSKIGKFKIVEIKALI